MQDIFFRIHLVADPSKFDRGAAIGAVCLDALAAALKGLPGIQVPVLAWGAVEREADAAEIKVLRAEVRKLQALVKELQAAKECKHEEIVDLSDAGVPTVEEELATVVEEPAAAPPAVPAQEAGNQQTHRRKRVR